MVYANDMEPENAPRDYFPGYCEENIHRLLGGPDFLDRPACALIVSNRDRRVAVFRQKSPGGGPVVWDYHVVAVARSGYAIVVYDFDTVLPFPAPFAEYMETSFPADVPRSLAPLFRRIPAPEYRSILVSDRSHMRDAHGQWRTPPPSWPAPGAGSGRRSNLMDLIDMSIPVPGIVLDRERLLRPDSWC